MTGIFWSKVAATAIGMSLALLAFPAVAPRNLLRLWNQHRVEQLRPQADLHRERVRASWSEGTPPAWSGSYRHSNGFEHRYLDMGPAGFYYEASHCTGTAEFAYGTIASVDGSRVRLQIAQHVIVERPAPREGRRQRFRLSADLYSVPWGEERFLVPSELMTEFCSLAQAGGWLSMKYADYPRRVAPGEAAWRWKLSLEGLPDVPAEFLRYLPR